MTLPDGSRERRRLDPLGIASAALLATAAVYLMHLAARTSGTALATFPFATTLVLVCGAPASPAAVARAVIGGHLICGLVALLGLELLPPSELATAGAVGVALGLMLAARCFHPPAGITPLVVAQFHPGWDFLLWPILTIAILIAVLSRALDAVRNAWRTTRPSGQ